MSSNPPKTVTICDRQSVVTFRELLRKRIEELTQHQAITKVSVRIGWGKSTLTQFLNDGKSLDKIDEIADGLDTTTERLLCGIETASAVAEEVRPMTDDHRWLVDFAQFARNLRANEATQLRRVVERHFATVWGSPQQPRKRAREGDSLRR